MKSHARRGQSGFSLVELLVTIIIAGIAFAAMVPLFVQAKQQTSADRVRNVALNVAQEKIELIRQIDWAEVIADKANPTSTPNLYNATFKNGAFGPTWTSDSGRVFTVDYAVTDVPDPSGSGRIAYKDVTVTVRWTAPPKPVKVAQLQTRVYRQSQGTTVTSLSAAPTTPTSPDSPLFQQLGLVEYIAGQVTLTATTAAPADFVTFFVYNGDGSLVAPAAQDIYHRGSTTFTSAWMPPLGLDGLYYLSAVATTGGYPGNTLQTSYYVETGAPLAPTSLLPQVGDARVVLSWTRPEANDFSFYRVYRSTFDALSGTWGPQELLLAADGQPVQAEVFVDATVVNETQYRYWVSAVDILGNESAKSSSVDAKPATPGDIAPPTAPGALQAATSGPSVILSWTSSTDDRGVLGYLVFRDNDLTTPIGRVGSSATSFIDPTAGYSQTHTYTVRAYDTSLLYSGLATLGSPLPAGQANVNGWLQVGTDAQAFYTLLAWTNKASATLSAVSQDTGKLYAPSVLPKVNKPAEFRNLPSGTYWVTGIYTTQRVTVVVNVTSDGQSVTINFK